MKSRISLVSSIAFAIGAVCALASVLVMTAAPDVAYAQRGQRTVVFSEAAWNPASIADGDEEVNDVAALGARLGDACVGAFSLDVTDVTVACSITAADVATVQLGNWTGGAIDLASGTVYVYLLKNPLTL